MQVQLFGVGVKGFSPAITAQRRINCYVEPRMEGEKTKYALLRRPGLQSVVVSLGASPIRGMWAVNSLTIPLLFVVVGENLYSINSAFVTTLIGTLLTSTGTVVMSDNGTYLVLVDGTNGYTYNMVAPAGINQITSGNFTTSPSYVTWQDTYFIVTSGKSNQFQLSTNNDPTTWPAVNINFSGSNPSNLKAGIANGGLLILFGDYYMEFWQNAGTPDFPYANLPGAANEFGLAAKDSLTKYQGALAGIFQSKMGGYQVALLEGFKLHKISTSDIDNLLSSFMTVSDAQGFAYKVNGHPFYVLVFTSANRTLVYDGLSTIWSEYSTTEDENFPASRFAFFNNQQLVGSASEGVIYALKQSVYTDEDEALPMEVISRHLWKDDKFIGISRIQIDTQPGVGTAGGQGEIPVMDLRVSKDGGLTFYSVGYSSVGKIGEFTQRTIWNSLGAARDWVLSLRMTDPVNYVITGATAEMTEAPY